MKLKTLLRISPLVISISCAFPLLAQDSSPAPTPANPAQNPRLEHPGDHGPGAGLSPEDREKLKAAHQKAMQDPKVQEAQKAFQEAQKTFTEALKAAMLAADPTIGPLLEKMGNRIGGPRGPGGPGGPGGPEGGHHRGDSGTSPAPAASSSPTP